MWICDCCKNANADSEATCGNCGDLGPLGEEIRHRAAQRPGEQFIWMLALSVIFLWPFAALLKLAREEAASVAALPGQQAVDTTELILWTLAACFGLASLACLTCAIVWAIRRRRAGKALVDADE